MDFLVDFIKLDLLLSQPQTFTLLLFCFSFLNPLPSKLFRRIGIFTFFHSVYTDILIFFIPLSLHFLNSIVAMVVLIFWLFRELTTKQKIVMILFLLSFGLTMEVILNAALVYVGGINTHRQLLYDHVLLNMAFLYPQLCLINVASWFVRNRKMTFRRFFSTIVQVSEKPPLWQITVLISLQFAILSYVQIMENFSDTYNRIVVICMLYAVIFLTFCTLALMIRLMVQTRREAIKTTQNVYVEDINQMFASIRGQRHDFINHLQVIHSLTQMGKSEELQRYVRALVNETQEMSEIVNHNSPALAAFVQAKTAVAVAKGIAFSFELPQKPIEDDNSIRTIDMIKILGNLVDNAFDEVVKLPAGTRVVHAAVKYEDGNVVMKVANRGTKLEPELRKKILTAGYTTKKDGNHSGLGLTIVAERTKHYGGTLRIESNEQQGTSFCVSIPMRGAPVAK